MDKKLTISMIAAMDEKRGIGKDNKIPWHIKEDLVRLKNLTLNHTVILGRTSYDSMVWYYNKSGRQMPGKLYIVLTRNPSYKPEKENALAVSSVDEALELVRGRETEEAFVIGGQKIFEQFFPYADKLYLTVVKGSYDADAFFPDYSEFKKIVSEKESEENGVRYVFLELER